MTRTLVRHQLQVSFLLLNGSGKDSVLGTSKLKPPIKVLVEAQKYGACEGYLIRIGRYGLRTIKEGDNRWIYYTKVPAGHWSDEHGVHATQLGAVRHYLHTYCKDLFE
mgnify:CR=1 FL=1